MKRRLTELLVAALAVIAIFSAGCGDLASPQPRIATQAPDSTRPVSVVSGGKPAAPSRQRSDTTPSAGKHAARQGLVAAPVPRDESTGGGGENRAAVRERAPGGAPPSPCAR